jgi:uncharacterized Zn ribbon protein
MTIKKIKCESCEADYILKYEGDLYPIQCPFCGFEYTDNDDEIEEQESEDSNDEEDNWN